MSTLYTGVGWFLASETIEIGEEVIFGPYCISASSNHSRMSNSFRYGSMDFKPICIKQGTCAVHVTITAGSVVGSGTVVAANTVVRRELPDNVLAAGQPARIIETFE